jgi:hypothetical protein
MCHANMQMLGTSTHAGSTRVGANPCLPRVSSARAAQTPSTQPAAVGLQNTVPVNSHFTETLHELSLIIYPVAIKFVSFKLACLNSRHHQMILQG